MAEVFLCRAGQLDDRSRRDLRRAGVVVVEVEDPSACQFIRSTESIGADDMLWAAIDALRKTDGYEGSGARDQRERLANNLWRVINTQRAARGQVSSE